MADVKPKNQVMKLFLHDKPFLILRAIYYNDGHAYSASISKKVDCSYAYIVKLITVGLVEKIDGKYRIRENMSISEILASFIKPYIIDKILNRLQEYAVAIDKE